MNDALDDCILKASIVFCLYRDGPIASAVHNAVPARRHSRFQCLCQLDHVCWGIVCGDCFYRAAINEPMFVGYGFGERAMIVVFGTRRVIGLLKSAPFIFKMFKNKLKSNFFSKKNKKISNNGFIISVQKLLQKPFSNIRTGL